MVKATMRSHGRALTRSGATSGIVSRSHRLLLEPRLQGSQSSGVEKDKEAITLVQAGVTGGPDERWWQRERSVHGFH